MIKVCKLSKDKKYCIDNNGKTYTLQDVKVLGKNISVLVAKKADGSEYLKYRKNCANYNLTYKPIIQKYNDGYDIKEINIVLEDRGSSNKLIDKLLNYYAKKNNITLVCNILIAGGNSFINMCLDTLNPNADVLVVYDSCAEMSVIKGIERTMQFLKLEYNMKFVRFTPRCSEECALSFKLLQDEIKNLSIENLEFLKLVYNYKVSAIDYIKYDSLNKLIYVNNKSFKLGYKSTLLNKTINNLEQYLCDKLLSITNNTPYYFNKKMSMCWYNNCYSDITDCYYKEKIGTKNPNNTIIYNCNRTLLKQDKLYAIINLSIFGGFIDALNILLNRSNELVYINKKLTNIVGVI